MAEDPRDKLIAELTARIERLEEELKELRARNTELESQLHSAAPFRRRESKRKSSGQSKPPGRGPGHTGSYRVQPEVIDERVRVPLERCPQCGGPVQGARPRVQYIEELPPIRPLVTELTTECGCCANCGSVSSTHPLQTSTATGAAGTHLGPRALALTALLNKDVKLTMRSTTRVLKDCFGLSLSPGGLAQAVHRIGTRLKPLKDDLVRALRAAPAVYADETGWWLENRQAWLWVFTSADTTVYQVDDSRGRQVVLDMMGEAFTGTLVSDCLAAYEKLPYRMHKCYAHHLKAIATAKRQHPASADYLNRVGIALSSAIILKKLRPEMSSEDWLQRCRHLTHSIDEMLRAPPLGGAKVARRLQKRRRWLFTFLHDESVDATNNRAEQALRPAVIARKLSCGNRSRTGADAFEVLASIAATARQRGQDLIDLLSSRIGLCAT